MPISSLVRATLVALFLAVGLGACTGSSGEEPVVPSAPVAQEPGPKRYGTTIVASRELGTLKTRVGKEEFAGVMCSTCHTIDIDKAPAEYPTELEDFHKGMKFTHGALTCNSCHNPADRNTLRAANGKVIEFEDTMELCGQCHGPKLRDYQNGAHGGMSGYWDLDKGPRVRNNCINCHDPHDPVYPSMMPAPPPRDRFFGGANKGSAH
ncbi:cytochrome c3 family protein [Bradymonas sediminis]|uniref:cytochrome c3 family protein n=1 Tax=Bradymonas sediminis TaxID=1548548 RepID=UPI001060FBBA|nr:cytochrome c3 family protein [Bradymonas sediminis]TDP76077.1 hypothetical protein DFR33_103428 [Bradymonas sediminis]